MNKTNKQPQRTCPLCLAPLSEPIFKSDLGVVITSLCDVLPGIHEVNACGRCGHLSSPPLPNLTEYYKSGYQILVAAENEDQLYSSSGGVPKYRFDYQLETLLNKVEVPHGAQVLDYGAAKGTTLKRLFERRPDISPHLFDVSDIYRAFWDRFCPAERTAINSLPAEWDGRFDLVLSFYALEHVAEPRSFLNTVHRLLKPNGTAYIIVPDVFRNIGDFLVADHVNHFTKVSLENACRSLGFKEFEVDNSTHSGAFILTATAGDRQANQTLDGDAVEKAIVNAKQLSEHWSTFATRLRDFEKCHLDVGSWAVYGSGFYGTLTTICLNRPEAVTCFLDQNPHRWTKTLLDRPILPPESMPINVSGLYVGLNPASARSEIAKLDTLMNRKLAVFYP